MPCVRFRECRIPLWVLRLIYIYVCYVMLCCVVFRFVGHVSALDRSQSESSFSAVAMPTPRRDPALRTGMEMV